MGLFGDLSIFFLVGLVLDLIGFILHVVGLATPYWSFFTYHSQRLSLDSSYGLFMLCSGSSCAYYNSNAAADNYNAAAAMAVIGILLAIGGIIAAIIYIFKRSFPTLVKVAGGLSIAAFVFVIIGVIVWGADVNQDLLGFIGYSLGLSTAGAVLFLIAGNLLLADKAVIKVS